MKREDVVKAARAYIGTPFKEQGRHKGVGLDCVGLVLCVAHDLNAEGSDQQPITRTLYTDYSGQPTGTEVHQKCRKHLREKPVRLMKEGDVISLSVPSLPCHVAIVSKMNGVLSMVHAYNSGKKEVVEVPLDSKWLRRVAGCFEFTNIQD